MLSPAIVHSWLNQFEKKQSYLSDPLAQLVEQLKAAEKAGDETTARELVGRLPPLCDAFGSFESAEILEAGETRVECGIALIGLIDRTIEENKPSLLKDAAQLFREAAFHYRGHRHQLAVSEWMLGHVLWQLSGKANGAIEAWKHSIDLFSDLAESFLPAKADEQWYQQSLKTMKESLKEAIKAGGVPLGINP